MDGKPASSFRLAKARDASQRLYEAAVVTERRARRAKNAYVSFAANKVGPLWQPNLKLAAPEEDTTSLPPVPEHGFRTMSDVLRWCRDAVSARACFVVDAQGFVLEYEGAVTYGQMEDFGSQLTVILSRADETESAGRTRRVELDYDELHLTGIRLLNDELEGLTLAVVSEVQIKTKTLETIAAKLQEYVDRL